MPWPGLSETAGRCMGAGGQALYDPCPPASQAKQRDTPAAVAAAAAGGSGSGSGTRTGGVEFVAR